MRVLVWLIPNKQEMEGGVDTSGMIKISDTAAIHYAAMFLHLSLDLHGECDAVQALKERE